MSGKKSKARLEMGEEAWAERRREQNRVKALKHLSNKENREKRNDYVTFWRISIKQKLMEYKGGVCEICGYDKDCPGAYDFHHNNPEDKEFNISRYRVLNTEKLYKEVDKCKLVCKNCHSELHDDKEKRKEILARHEAKSRVKLEDIVCLCCGNKFKPTKSAQKYCSHKCNHIDKRKVKRPSKEELRHMIETMTWVAIGKEYGVSNNAVKKWAKKYNLK